MSDHIELSEREREILRLVATGASNKEIASRLFISANTVKVHLRNIFTKIEATSRTEAAMYAANIGLVDGIAPVKEEEVIDDPAPESIPVLEALPVPEIVPGRRLSLLWVGLVGLVILVLVVSVPNLLNRFPPPGSTPFAENPAVNQEPADWQTAAPLPAARAGLALAVAEDRIYAIGGEAVHGVIGDVTYYDSTADTWENASLKPTPVTDIQAAVLGGRIYVPGGKIPNGSISAGLEIYDPRADSWSAGADLPAPRSAYGLVAFEGSIYLFGGWDGEKYVNTVYAYDPEQDLWEPRQSLPAPVGYPGTVVAGGRIYLLGGFDGQRAVVDTYQYLPEAAASGEAAWRKLKPLPQGRYAMGVTSIADIIYVVGGISNQSDLPFLEYILPRDEWIPFSPGEKFDWSHGGMTILGTDLHILGGLGGEEYLT
ncbi:MAG TPA: LuxR C-terminal-related transcriptional regulator, partial [Anaerolineales bacterium]|nr:LuxR C-terminal-related transcriptional regulator [Anaerolineales bacterium]